MGEPRLDGGFGLSRRLKRRDLLIRAGGGALALAALPLVQACGGNDEEEPAGGAARTRTPETEGRAPATGRVVEMTNDLKFKPDRLTIKVGETVTWRNTGTVPHTATCDPNKASNKSNVKLASGAEPWDSGIVQGGKSFSHTFAKAGEYKYFCIPHELQGMVATLTVEG